MKKFLVTYHSSAVYYEKMKTASPEMRKQVMQNWMSWSQENKGNLVDFGAPVVASGKNLSKEGATSSESEFAGYFVLQAESIDEVVSLLQNHPHIQSDDSSTLKIHEMMSMPKM